MWRDLEVDALVMGLSLDEFWHLTPVKFKKYNKAYELKMKNEMQKQDHLNNLLGIYLTYAFHSPNKYPKPFLANVFEEENKEETEEEKIIRIARKNTLMLGGVIKNDS